MGRKNKGYPRKYVHVPGQTLSLYDDFYWLVENPGDLAQLYCKSENRKCEGTYTLMDEKHLVNNNSWVLENG